MENNNKIVVDIFLQLRHKEEYFGDWLKCNCGTLTPAYAYYCCGCGRKVEHIHTETKEEYEERSRMELDELLHGF